MSLIRSGNEMSMFFTDSGETILITYSLSQESIVKFTFWTQLMEVWFTWFSFPIFLSVFFWFHVNFLGVLFFASSDPIFDTRRWIPNFQDRQGADNFPPPTFGMGKTCNVCPWSRQSWTSLCMILSFICNNNQRSSHKKTNSVCVCDNDKIINNNG